MGWSLRPERRRSDAPLVGIGMIPRGEVGLIFAGMGAALIRPGGQPVLGRAAFSAVVMIGLATTLITPPCSSGLSPAATVAERKLALVMP